MTTELNNRTTTVTITDILDYTKQCVIHVRSKLLRYESNDEYYDIGYTYTYSTTDSTHLNPFNEALVSESSEGDIIKRTPMIDQMIETLFMSESDLEAISGHTAPTAYKAITMRALSMFWD